MYKMSTASVQDLKQINSSSIDEHINNHDLSIEEYDQIQRKPGSHHPWNQLQARANLWNVDVLSAEFAREMDREDPLRGFRDKFHIPQMRNLSKVDTAVVEENDTCVYLCGNSLGLQPKITKKYVERELNKWAKTGVFGHFEGHMPWASCDEVVNKKIGTIVGAKVNEVAFMNGLTVNLHLLLLSCYKPTGTRHKILLESKAFPSDHYAIESQIRLRGYNPKNSMVFLEPRKGEDVLRKEDILATIDEQGDSIAVICLPGVQYYTGQLFDMQSITRVGHGKGCIVGFDLAHAVGNVEIHLHDWGVDFACWCTYKYLNSGAGCLSGAFLHEKHRDSVQPTLLGWWSHRMSTRFDMTNELELSPGIEGFRISNPAMLLCASFEASLDVFSQTSMKDLRSKSLLLTAYAEMLLTYYFPKPLTKTDSATPDVYIMTPSDPAQRGCQLSLKFSRPIDKVLGELQRRGCVVDERKPNVIRVAPTPLYNSFEDVHRFVSLLRVSLQAAGN